VNILSRQLTVVIPTYNEAENLLKLASALFSLPIPRLKVLVVDDCSPDGTGEVADALDVQYTGRVGVIHRQGKLGLGSAYIAGFRRALQEGAEAVAQMDADFSHPPAKLLELLEAIEDIDVAMGSRYIPGGKLDERWPAWRRGLSAFGNIYARTILSLPMKDVTGGFRVWRRETLLRLPLDRVRSNGYAFQVEMACLAHLAGCTYREIPIYFADRRWGQSKMSFRIQAEAAVRVWQLFFAYRGVGK
jgi:dolichol-phosphate mannosyltransferase